MKRIVYFGINVHFINYSVRGYFEGILPSRQAAELFPARALFLKK